MTTAELEAPATAEAAPGTNTVGSPDNAPASTPQSNGETQSAPKSGDRPRGDNGKFRARDVKEKILDSFRKKQSARAVASGEQPPQPPSAAAPKQEAKPSEKQLPASTFDDATLKRIHDAGLTEYEARKAGDKLEESIAKRAQERQAATASKAREEAAKAETQRPEQQPEQQRQQAAAPSKVGEMLGKLQDLPDEYGSEMVERDKLTRGIAQQLHDELTTLRQSFAEEIGRLQESRKQDEQRRAEEARTARVSEYESALSDLGADFHPVFGRGAYHEVGEAYQRTREEIFPVAELAAQLWPDFDVKKAARVLALARYSDIYEDRVTKTVLENARKSASRVTAPAGTNAPATEPPKSIHDTPSVRRAKERAAASRQGA